MVDVPDSICEQAYMCDLKGFGMLLEVPNGPS